MNLEIFRELERRVEEFGKVWRDHDADVVRKEFFAPEACVVGEGMPCAAREESSVISAIEGMFRAAPLLKVEIVKMRECSSSIIASWLNWHVVNEDGAVLGTMRSLTVWGRINGSLVILDDSYSAGAI